jgi:hypothetical protein
MADISYKAAYINIIEMNGGAIDKRSWPVAECPVVLHSYRSIMSEVVVRHTHRM